MQHDGGRVDIAEATTVVSWPKGSFAENLAVDEDGSIFVTLHTDRAVVKVDPALGQVAPFVTFDRPCAGIALTRTGELIVSGGTPGTTPGVIWRVQRDGAVELLAEIEGAAFLNGVTPMADRFLIADSLGGVLYVLDPAANTVEPWLVDPRLAPATVGREPGANGVKLFEGEVTVSVTAADRILRAPVHDGAPGPLTVIAEGLRADDFAFDEGGALFIATHPAHSLMRLDPDGTRTTLARAEQGMVGATAVAFGRLAADRHCVYVTTTGGTWTMPDDRLEPAKLVRVAVGRGGHPLHDGSVAV